MRQYCSVVVFAAITFGWTDVALTQNVQRSGSDVCAQLPRNERAQVRDSSGIRIVESPQGMMLPKFVIDSNPLLTIGAAPRTQRADFTMVWGLLRLSSGSIVVVDGLFNTRISLFDSSGKFLTYMSREGSGPAEYEAVHRVFRLVNDTLLLADVPGGRLIYMAPDGKVARTRALPRSESIYTTTAGPRAVSTPVLPAGILTNGGIVGTARLPRTTGSGELRLYRDATKVFYLGPASDSWVEVASGLPLNAGFLFNQGGGLTTGSQPFGAVAALAFGTLGFYHGDGAVYSISRYTSTGKVDQISRVCGSPSRLASPDLRSYRDSVLESARSPTHRASLEALLRQLPMPTHRAAHGHLIVDEINRLWVNTSEPGESGNYDVFSRDGELMATARLPRGTLQIGSDYVLMVRLDVLDVPSVYMHRLRLVR